MYRDMLNIGSEYHEYFDLWVDMLICNDSYITLHEALQSWWL